MTTSPLADRLSERRHELGLSVAQLAERTGLLRAHLHYIERDPRGPGDFVLGRLADALKLDVAELKTLSGSSRANLRDAADDIEDDELRDTIQRLMDEFDDT